PALCSCSPTRQPFGPATCFSGCLMLAFRLFTCGSLLLAMSVPTAAQAPLQAIELSVEPAQVALTHASDRQRLLVTGKFGDGSLRDLTRMARFACNNPAIAQVTPEGTIIPK